MLRKLKNFMGFAVEINRYESEIRSCIFSIGISIVLVVLVLEYISNESLGRYTQITAFAIIIFLV